MSFANPVFFWAMFSLALPVIIHLFRFRRFKTVYFTNVRFLQELKEETQSRSRLRHLLILLARCLALASLVFAFTRPFIPATRKSVAGERAVSIYIDNSFSLDARGESSSLLELARKHALDIVSSYKQTDRFQLITNDFEGRHQRLLSQEEFTEMLKDVNPSPAVKKLSDVISRQKDLLNQSGAPNKIIYLISDFQKGSSNISQSQGDTLFGMNCVQLQPRLADNISLDSAWFVSPFRQHGKPEQLTIKASNHSGKRFENIPLKLQVNGIQRGLESLSFGPDSSVEKNISFSIAQPGFQSAEIEITDYPIVFDDKFYISWNVPEKIRTLCINGGGDNPFLSKLFLSNPAFDYKNTALQQLDYAALGRQECILLNGINEVSSGLAQELKKFTTNGGTLLVFPSVKADLASWMLFSNLLGTGNYQAPLVSAQKVGQLNAKHRIYDDVFEKQPDNIDLPEVKVYLPIKSPPAAREEIIMKLQNGDPFLTQFDVGKGKVYLCASPLEEAAGNFPKHALFIPTVYKIALYSFPASRLYFTIGKEETVELSNVVLAGDQTLRIKALKGDFEMIPEHRVVDGKVQVFLRNRIREAGNYQIMQDNQVLANLSFNYDRLESALQTFSKEELETQLEKAGWKGANILDGAAKEIRQSVAELDEGKPLWKLFIILALVFLAAEIFLIRWLK